MINLKSRLPSSILYFKKKLFNTILIHCGNIKRFLAAGVIALCGTTVFAQRPPRVALVPLENRAGAQYEYDVETLSDMLATFIHETRHLNVIDRQTLEVVAAAWGWKADDLADNAKAAQMSRAINVQYIIRGTVSRLGDNLLVSVRMLDINTAEVWGLTNTQLEHMNEAYSKMNSLAQRLANDLQAPSRRRSQPTQKAQPPETAAMSPDKLNIGINANPVGLLLLGPSICMEFTRGNFNSEINLIFSSGILTEFSLGYGALVTFNYFWHSRIGGAYLGGGIGYAFYESYYDDNNNTTQNYRPHSLAVGLNGGYKFVTPSGFYIRIGAFVGVDFGFTWNRGWTMPVYIKPELAIGLTMR